MRRFVRRPQEIDCVKGGEMIMYACERCMQRLDYTFVLIKTIREGGGREYKMFIF
jgi:hypothetical protein